MGQNLLDQHSLAAQRQRRQAEPRFKLKRGDSPPATHSLLPVEKQCSGSCFPSSETDCGLNPETPQSGRGFSLAALATSRPAVPVRQSPSHTIPAELIQHSATDRL